MKKSLFVLLMIFVSVHSFAQIQRVAEFDFTNPTKLNPAITPPVGNNTEENVTDKTFRNADIWIDFKLGGQGLGTAITNFTNIYTGATTYYLKIGMQAVMSIHSPINSKINEIKFDDNSVIGDLHLTDQNLGQFSDDYLTWTNSKLQAIHDLTFKNSFASSQLHKITITYTIPSAVLDATSSIVDGSVISDFEKLALTFDHKMSIKNASKIILSDGTNSQNLTASIDGNIVTLTSSEKIVKEGTYTLIVPAKAFVDKDGFENKEIQITFTIKNAFNYVSVNPVPGYVLSLPLTISLNYGDAIVGFVDESANISLYKDGEPYVSVKAKKNSENNTVALNLQNLNNEITEKGTYVLKVPANVVCNGMYGNTEEERYNSAFELTYIVDDSETMRHAKTLLKNNGVGYPAESSKAYSKLKKLVNQATTPTDVQISDAINNYYNETNVNLPLTGKWYQIASINAKGEKLYLSCKDGIVTLEDNPNDATSFEATNSDGAISLKSIDDEFLGINGLIQQATSQDASLTLKKLDGKSLKMETGEAYDASKVLGLMTISGAYENSIGEELIANALVNHQSKEYKTDVSVTSLYLQNKLTSAFVFSEVNKPAEAIKTVETEYELSPYIVENNTDVLTLEFKDVNNVTISTEADAYFANTNGERVADAIFTLVDGTTNQFTVSLEGLANADYNLVIPEGTFFYVKDGKQVKTQAIDEMFTIGKNGSVDDPNLNFDYSNVQLLPSADYVNELELNNILIKNIGYYNGLVANPSMTVRLAVYESDKTVRTGHLESYVDPEDPESQTLKCIWETPIKKGDLANITYGLVLEKGTYGDSNFGKFLKDKTSVDASSCHTNQRSAFPFFVDNTITGIKDIHSDIHKTAEIYDLTGRRISEITTPGIYIVNGKKFIKK